MSTLTGLLCFSLVAGLLQGQAHSSHLALHGLLAARLPEQLGQVLLPLGLLLAIVLPLARSLAVWVVLPAPSTAWHERWLLTGCGLRAAVPLALAVSMTEELSNLRGVAPALAEPLGAQLLALLFVVVLADLLLQPLLMRRLLPFSPETSPP